MSFVQLGDATWAKQHLILSVGNPSVNIMSAFKSREGALFLSLIDQKSNFICLHNENGLIS